MMRFQLRFDDPLPLYAQLERAIKLAIASGDVKIGDRLPTVRQLAVDLRVNANTIAKVYSELERQGVLTSKRGVGTFVQSQATSSVPRGERVQMLRAMAERFLAEATSNGFTADELIDQLRRSLVHRKEKSHAHE